jgi:predicted XRE-type DNA-binding protein
MANREIRELIDKKGIKHYKVAQAMGVSASTFCVWMRLEMPQDKKDRIIETINSMEL